MKEIALATVFATASALAGQWPAWRGSEGSGLCDETQLPFRWSTNENVRWHVALPDRGNSTPIVWSNRVFVTQAIAGENRRTLMCFDGRDGKLLWQRGPVWPDKELTHPDNPPCTPSPVTDGERVIAWFGSAGLYCFDFDGRELWRRDLGLQKHVWGYASSPVLYRDLCFLNFGPGPRSFIIALDKKTGATVWQRDAPGISANAKWVDFGGQAESDKPGGQTVAEIAGSWATPLIVPVTGGDELVVAFALQLRAFVPATGELLWTCAGPNIGVYGSPFFGEGLVVLNANGLTNTVTTVRPGGRGDITKTHRAWLQLPGNNKFCLGAGVIHRGHIYQMNMTGLFECRAMNTGQLLWEERLTGTGARNTSWSAPVLAGDRLYIANRNADVFVLRASPKFECLATNSIGSEPMNASLAMANGSIFIRTDRQLWCISR
jgi:outer membrane protein assembly factor BamB